MEFILNGKPISYDGPADRKLAEFLHLDLGLSATRVSCEMGVCKACTVAIRTPPDKPWTRAQACITPMSYLEKRELITVEGLTKGGKLHPLQEAFLKHHSFQCGYSTSGFLMAGFLVLDQLKHQMITEKRLDALMNATLGGHICRCTGYKRYYSAIQEVALQVLRGKNHI